jgi:hypothetical protein
MNRTGSGPVWTVGWFLQHLRDRLQQNHGLSHPNLVAKAAEIADCDLRSVMTANPPKKFSTVF